VGHGRCSLWRPARVQWVRRRCTSMFSRWELE
jgi:hypothetical protein